MTGVMPLLLYGKLLLKCLYSAKHRQLTSQTAVYTTIGTTCVAIAIFTVDRVGRRTMFRTLVPMLFL